MCSPKTISIHQNPLVFFLSEKKIPPSACLFEKYPYLCRRNELNFVKMIACLKYIAPSVEQIRLQLEGVMADVSCWPTIKAGTPEYWEFEDYDDTPASEGNILLF
jgi:hypothetical protein